MTGTKSIGLRQLLIAAARMAIVCYLALIVLVAIFQRRLLYFPQVCSVADAQQTAAGDGLVPWTNSTGEIIGWKFPALASSAGSVMLVHGNGGNALWLSDLANDIRMADHLDVFILEYPGYGHRKGSPSEESFLAAADDGFGTLPTNRPIYLVSLSLGTGVAAHLAQKYPARVAGLLMFVPYDRLASVAQSHFAILPAYYLLLDRFAPVDWLADYRGPVKIVIAGQDKTIPPRRGRNLFDSYRGPKSLEIMPDAGHNDTAQHSPEWWRAVLKFWQTAKAGN